MTSSRENLSITKEQVLNLLKQHSFQVKIIDVRDKEEYLEKHIGGAIYLPLDTLTNTGNIFDLNDHLIIACGKGGGRSMQGAENLRAIGYKNVYWLEGGTFGWF